MGGADGREPTIAVIGVGAMGSQLANRLLRSGHTLVVWNRSAARLTPLVKQGATSATSPADAAARAEVVITMVADPGALRDITEGPRGLASQAAGTTVIQMSTVRPTDIHALAAVLPASAELLDAPVLGSISEAEAGKLTIFVSGSRSVADRWEPLLSVFGSPMYVGEAGQGSAAKLVANSVLLGVLGVFGEALLLAKHLGLSSSAAFDVLARTPLASQVERRRTAVETGEFPLRFALSLARKDADLILDASTEAGAQLRLAEAMRAWLLEAEQTGRADEDYSSVIAHIMDR